MLKIEFQEVFDLFCDVSNESNHGVQVEEWCPVKTNSRYRGTGVHSWWEKVPMSP